MRHCLLLACLLFAAACLAPPSPAERLSFSAHELNAATRFGRLDVAMSHVQTDQQGDFARRHSDWHRKLRIVDVELRGMQMLTSDTAEVVLDVSWHHLDETTMRSSAVSQRWKQSGNDWRLTEEHRVDGSKGLFKQPHKGKGVDKSQRPQAPDTKLAAELL